MTDDGCWCTMSYHVAAGEYFFLIPALCALKHEGVDEDSPMVCPKLPRGWPCVIFKRSVSFYSHLCHLLAQDSRRCQGHKSPCMFMSARYLVKCFLK